MKSKPVLIFSHVVKSFKDGDTCLDILKDISFTLNEGEFIGLVGPSGAGKSTLLSLAGALSSPSEGEIVLNGTPVSAMSERQHTALRLKEIGFIFQSAHLVPFLTVREQLLFVSRLLHRPDKEAERRAYELLNRLDLSQRVSHYPDKLSGGERQRVAIARALMNDPSLILADEPTASLDLRRAKTVVAWLNHKVKAEGKGVLMVTHDERMLEWCDRVIRLEDGQIIASE